MALVEQTFLKPGRYGKAGEWSRERIAAHVEGTKKLLGAGYRPFVFLEHEALGSTEGEPKQFSSRDQRANQLRNACGELVDCKVNSDGSAAYTLDVKDKGIARKLKNGSIKHTSPEFRHSWEDGKGVDFANIISHVGLTHKPRAIDQGPITEVAALQFSLADYEGPIMPATQFSDDDEKKKKPDFLGEDDDDGDSDDGGDNADGVGDKAPENPDMPESGPSEDTQTDEAIVAHLSELGVVLPSKCDINSPEGKQHLLTALMTAAHHTKKADAEDDKEDNEQPATGPLTEQQPPMQFSLADAESGKTGDKLRDEVIVLKHQRQVDRLDKLVAGTNITPHLRKRILAHSACTQFSAFGAHQIAFSLPDLVTLLEKCTSPGMAVVAANDATAEQFSAAAEGVHPKGAEFTSKDGGAVTDAEAEATARRIHSRTKV